MSSAFFPSFCGSFEESPMPHRLERISECAGAKFAMGPHISYPITSNHRGPSQTYSGTFRFSETARDVPRTGLPGFGRLRGLFGCIELLGLVDIAHRSLAPRRPVAAFVGSLNECSHASVTANMSQSIRAFT
jgi:hypothetical protein